MRNKNHRPSRAEVARALREIESLWTRPDESSNVTPFRRPLRTCNACGQHLDATHEGATCTACVAWDRTLRGVSISRQALGELTGN